MNWERKDQNLFVEHLQDGDKIHVRPRYWVYLALYAIILIWLVAKAAVKG